MNDFILSKTLSWAVCLKYCTTKGVFFAKNSVLNLERLKSLNGVESRTVNELLDRSPTREFKLITPNRFRRNLSQL